VQKAKLPELEKAHRQSERALERFEKQHGLSSEDFFPRYESGELTGEDHDKWAQAMKAHKENSRNLEEKRKGVEAIEPAHRLAFIQCVGSRDIRFNRFCSGFCCMHAIKEAIIAREHDHQAEVYIFGMDIRAVGKGFEEYRNRGGKEAGVQYIRSRVAEVVEDRDHNPVIWYEDTKAREVRSLTVDLVVLSTACEPSAGMKQLAEIVGAELNDFGFFKTNPFQPLDTSRQGVFVCGCAHSPMDIPESVAQASSAAARAAQVISGPMPARLAS
jgi:heterodisulfide reductase subunit A